MVAKAAMPAMVEMAAYFGSKIPELNEHKDDVIKIFERYVDNYIRCSECKSVDTNLIEKYIHCEVCGYEKKTK